MNAAFPPPLPTGVPAFVPAPGMGNPHLQSLLASSALRRKRALARWPELIATAQTTLIDCGDGTRLEGAYSPAAGTPRGLIILFHGWEGSIESSYMYASGGALHAAGWSVFRLNFRDHGDSHHLNAEPFHSCRIDEVLGAVAEILRQVPVRPVVLVGFSLGGNFALRVALHGPGRGLPIAHACAVCPPLMPSRVMAQLESSPFAYEAYFMRKWTASLKRKAELFPEHYPDRHWLKTRRLRALTAQLVERYTSYPSIEAYLDGYAVGGQRLLALPVPATIIAAADDPVIPARDLAELAVPPQLTLIVHPRGGHCGFLEDWQLRSWPEHFLPAHLNAVVRQGAPENPAKSGGVGAGNTRHPPDPGVRCP